MSFYNKIKMTSDLVLTQTNPVSEDDTIQLEIVDHADSVRAPLKKKLVLGRRDADSTILPDVDLTPYDAYRNGVSRNHAWMRCNGDGYIEITDLGSSNGTYLNKRRLRPHIAQVVHNGDRIRLGKIEMIVRYPEGNTRM